MSRICEDDIAASIADRMLAADFDLKPGAVNRLRSAEPADHPNRRDYKPDPLRPDPITLQAHDDLHDHDHGSELTPERDNFEPLTGPFGRAMTGEDAFDLPKIGPWRFPASVDSFLRDAERNERVRLEPMFQSKWEQDEYEHGENQRLAKEALARMEAHLPPGATDRKGIPVATGFIDYFPDAVAAVAQLSRIGNDQHNPGTPLHWDRSKSGDESDCLMRHFLERGTFDNDGVRHSVKVAWRAMALLQKEIEAAKERLEPIFR